VAGPSSKRCAAEHLKSTGVSERRACRLLEQSRSSQRYQPSRKDEEKRLVERMLELVRAHPRRGYRMIWSMLVAEGWKVNRKRIYRLWRREGLRVPKKKHKKTRLGKPENGCTRKKAERKNHVWAWDFVHDRTQDGRPLKWLALVDEYTRELVALKVERSIKAKDAVKLLEEVFAKRGTPEHLRSDNGPEFIAQAMRQHLEKSGVSTLYIEPGAPWENGYAESFNSRFRDEFLGCEEFTSLLEAKVIGEEWRKDYNERRPHSSLGYKAPAVFAAGCGNAVLMDSSGETKLPFPPTCPQDLTNGANSRPVAHIPTAPTTAK